MTDKDTAMALLNDIHDTVGLPDCLAQRLASLREASLRGSGRTTRMLERAAAAAARGKAVCIVTHSVAERLRLYTEYMSKHRGVPAPNATIRNSGGIGFVRFVLDREFCYKTLKFPAMTIYDVVYVDHAAIERSFALMLEMQHKFDTPPSQADLISDIP